MNTAELIAKVRQIEIKSRRITNNLLGGQYHSHFKGRGMTFSEVRPYEFGDDVRAIDWNVTAKTKMPHIKVFEEERELSLLLLVDFSNSGFFGTRTKLKAETMIEICATLAFSALKNNDKVGLLIFAEEVEFYIPPKKGKGHILRLLRELLDFKPKTQKTNISGAIKFINSLKLKRSIVFIVSDFYDNDYYNSLKLLSKKHDCTGFRIYDALEEKLPNVGLLKMYDSETKSEFLIDTSSANVRNNWNANYEKFANNFSDSFRKSSAGAIHLRTDESYVKKLMLYFSSVK
jgi:uncharacterized protein (DUF58 family)